MAKFKYEGPADVLVIGDKRLVRGGDAVELTVAERRLAGMYDRYQTHALVKQPKTKLKEGDQADVE